MTIPPAPWFLRFIDGGNAKTSAIAAIAFTIGYMWGKGDRNKWQEVARSYDNHWQNHESHGRHTDRERDREHDRDNHRKYGGQHDR